jgi:hypothetical protein
VVGVEREVRLVPLFLPGAVEPADRAAIVGAADPAVACPELEAGEFRLCLDRVEGGEQGRGVDAVAAVLGGGGHRAVPFKRRG